MSGWSGLLIIIMRLRVLIERNEYHDTARKAKQELPHIIFHYLLEARVKDFVKSFTSAEPKSAERKRGTLSFVRALASTPFCIQYFECSFPPKVYRYISLSTLLSEYYSF